MNTGSNPVGVASAKPAETQGSGSENGTSDQVHVPRVYQGRRKAGLEKVAEVRTGGPVMCPGCDFENQVVPGKDRCAECLEHLEGLADAPSPDLERGVREDLDEALPHPGMRTCAGIPGRAPGEQCDAVLGPEVPGDRCAMCARELRLRAEVLIEETPVTPANVAKVLAYALERAWEAIAGDASLDPRTVAVCKRLRDLERGL